MWLQVSAPPGFTKVSLGRGRGKLPVFETPVAQSNAAAEEEEAKRKEVEERRKKEKKLKKMYRQVYRCHVICVF